MSEIVKPISDDQIKILVEGGETAEVEFKIKPPRDSELAERICGMANSRTGGIIIFGVEDKTTRPVGLDKPNEAIDSILKATRLVKPPVALEEPGPMEFNLDGAKVVAIKIPRNNGTLYQVANGFLLRKGSFTMHMTTEEVEERLGTYGSTRWERGLCTRASMADLDHSLIEKYLAYRGERGRRSRRYTSTEELLVGLECAATDRQSQELKPTNVGILMFAYDPQLYLPQSEVVCIRYADSLGVGKYIDRKNLFGNVVELIDKATDFLNIHSKVGAEIRGFRRADIPDYPMEALREAVVNAIVHRDYSRVGESIRIFIYNDRIEVRSPGVLLPGITIDDMVHMTVTSRPRNPLIAQFLRDIPGYMEKVGSGIRLMINEMRQLGLSDPEFAEVHEFVVTFRNGMVTSSSDIKTESRLNSRQLIALQMVREKGSFSSSEYRGVTGATETTARRDLNDLLERGVLISKGNKRALRYYLP